MVVCLTGLNYVSHHCFGVVILLKALGRDLYGMIKHENSAKRLSVVNSDVLVVGFLAVNEFNILVYLRLGDQLIS